MSKLMENKHMIHIVSEIVALLGITFYFNQQNQRLKGYIEDLAQRMEEQEEALKRQEDMIKTLAGLVNNISNRPPPPSPIQHYEPKQRKTVRIQETPSHDSTPPAQHKSSKPSAQNDHPIISHVLPQQLPTISEIHSDDDESGSEMDTDDELREELKELAEVVEREDDLKKEEQ